MEGRLGRRGLALVAAFVLVSCSGAGNGGRRQDSPRGERPPPVYVAVGASDSVGVGADDPPTQAWPEVFRRAVLPPDTVFVNLGIEGVNTAEALAGQVPRAVDLEPDLVTVWLNVNDIIDQVPPDQYERELGEVVRQLRRNDRTKVLVANAPDIDQLPAVGRLGGAVATLARLSIDAYNQATARVAAAHGAVLVDLHGASREVAQSGRYASLVAADGFHPNTAGHAEVARVFAEAFRASGGI